MSWPYFGRILSSCFLPHVLTLCSHVVGHLTELIQLKKSDFFVRCSFDCLTKELCKLQFKSKGEAGGNTELQAASIRPGKVK